MYYVIAEELHISSFGLFLEVAARFERCQGAQRSFSTMPTNPRSTVQTAFQTPNMNAIAERFIGSLKGECLDRLILFGEDHLRRVLREYIAHYNTDRPHQGIGNELIAAPTTTDSGNPGPIVEHERLGGLLRSYSCVA